MAEKKDKYIEWVEQGKLRQKLNATHILVKCDVKEENMSCLVLKIFNYKTFNELYLKHSKVSIGYKEDEIAKPEDMLVYYSMEEIKNYGVLGIEIKVL